MMNEEIYTQCIQWEKVFHNAIKINFLRMSMDEWNKIAALYEAHFNKKIRPNERGCNNCRLRIVKEMGTAYFNEKTAREVKAAKEKEKEKEKESIDNTETTDNIDTTDNTEKPKKIGRPRKINLDA